MSFPIGKIPFVSWPNGSSECNNHPYQQNQEVFLLSPLNHKSAGKREKCVSILYRTVPPCHYRMCVQSYVYLIYFLLTTFLYPDIGSAFVSGLQPYQPLLEIFQNHRLLYILFFLRPNLLRESFRYGIPEEC